MADPIVARFIEALSALETERALDPITACFSEQAELGSAAAPHVPPGREGVRSFWHMYRDAFQALKSSFHNVIACEGKAALEWTTDGTSRLGEPICYHGVSVLEHDGQLITRFFAYFDPAVFAAQKNGHARVKDPVILHLPSEDLVRETP